jgi:hypothetical protein
MAMLSHQGDVPRKALDDSWTIDMQRAEILQDSERSIELRPGTGNPHAHHPGDHATSPLAPIT